MSFREVDDGLSASPLTQRLMAEQSTGESRDGASRALRRFHDKVSSVSRLLERLKQNPTNHTLMQKLNQEIERAMQLAKETRSLLQELNGLVNRSPGPESRRIKVQHEKLLKDFEQEFKKFDKLVKEAVEMEQLSSSRIASVHVSGGDPSRSSSINPSNNTNATGTTSGSSGTNPFADEQQMQLQQQQQQQLLQDTVLFNEQDLMQREQDFSQLQRSVHQLNQLYVDLAGLVEEQNEDIGQIEAQVTQAEHDTTRGLNELTKSALYRRKVSPFAFWLMMILLVFVVVLVVLVVKK